MENFSTLELNANISPNCTTKNKRTNIKCRGTNSSLENLYKINMLKNEIKLNATVIGKSSPDKEMYSGPNNNFIICLDNVATNKIEIEQINSTYEEVFLIIPIVCMPFWCLEALIGNIALPIDIVAKKIIFPIVEMTAYCPAI